MSEVTEPRFKDGDDDGGPGYTESIKITEVSNGWIVEYCVHDPYGEVHEDVEVYNDGKNAVESIIQLMGLENSVNLR